MQNQELTFISKEKLLEMIENKEKLKLADGRSALSRLERRVYEVEKLTIK